jgi:N,N'-diacetyllegionaminate synthase
MKTIIIAEAGVNHNGDLQTAYKLIDVAVDAGVDYVKFQTFKAEKLASKLAQKATYQKENTGDEVESQFQMLQNLELSHENHIKLIDYCKAKKINFFSTAFDLTSLQYLASLGLEIVKVPSGEITNLPYLELAAKLFTSVILSTGMSTMNEIQEAVAVFVNAGIPKEKITILHCNTEYPTPMQDVNLKAMLSIKETLNTAVGYSDHTLGIEVPIAAVALGAVIIEKHFTLDRNLPGPDHIASLEPSELKDMVKAIRNIELAVSGNGIKEPSPSEMKNMEIARKSIHVLLAKKKGEVLTANDLEMLRPGDGISPMKFNEVVGKTLKEDVLAGHKLSNLDFE